MEQNLFPVFEVPADLVDEAQTEKQYAHAPLWDFEKGDFVEKGERQWDFETGEPVEKGARQPGYGSGYDAWVQWCKKTVLTQRWAHAGYGDNAGIEAEEALRKPDRNAMESALEETISEALLSDPMGRTSQVRDFQFTWRGGDQLEITCEVIGSDGNSADIDTTLKM